MERGAYLIQQNASPLAKIPWYETEQTYALYNVKVTVKSIYFTCGSLKVTKTKFLFFKNVLHRELERKVEKVKHMKLEVMRLKTKNNMNFQRE